MSVMMLVFIVALLVVLMLVFKAKEVRHKMGFLIAAVLCLFLIFSFIQIYKTSKTDLKSFDGIVKAGKLYFSWLGQVFANTKNTVGYAVKQDWSANNTIVSQIK